MTDPVDLEWRPFQEAHSIEVVAASINFSEPLTEVAWKRVVRDAEGAAKAAGLSEKANLQGFEITIGPAQPQQAAQIAGVRFMRTTTAFGEPGGQIQRKFQEAVSINRDGLIFQSGVYTRWDAFRERMQLLLRPAFRSALHSVGVVNLRLEYKDGFRYVGSGKALARTLLNPNSNLIASHVFDNEQLWHSHTGFFEPASGCKERLIQINIDANMGADVNRPNDLFRMVTITTGVQNNFETAGQEPVENEEELARFYLSMFESLHDKANALLKNLVLASVAERIGLQ